MFFWRQEKLYIGANWKARETNFEELMHSSIFQDRIFARATIGTSGNEMRNRKMVFCSFLVSLECCFLDTVDSVTG